MVAMVDIITFGCRLNALDSEVIRENADRSGLADAIVVNSCAVTGEAVRQARQAIRKAARAQPGRRIVVTGCAAQIEPQTFAAMPEVDLVLGNEEKLARAAVVADGTRIRVGDIMATGTVRPHPVGRMAGRARAFVQIQTGCDHRCSFCIIPFGRGNSRSVPADDVVDQVRRLVEAGHLEVVLTGVDLTSYGADLADPPRLGALVRRILAEVPELPRLRLSSVDSIEIDAELVAAIAEEPRLMPHLHLSLQSGDDMILKRMKRRHLRGDAIALCAELKRLRPEIAFGADLIAGFPTETEAMFEQSLAIVEECDLTHLHVFPFSPRPGTPAARMPQLDRGLVKERAARLRDAGEAAYQRRLAGEIGATGEVLVEADRTGRSGPFMPAVVEAAKPGSLARVRFTGQRGRTLVAEPLPEAA
jgi:threonylcarbamoyladenosine tRNA methylthiotransferase MtaB